MKTRFHVDRIRLQKKKIGRKNLFKKDDFNTHINTTLFILGNLSIRFLNQGSRQKKSDGTMEGLGRPAIEKSQKVKY